MHGFIPFTLRWSLMVCSVFGATSARACSITLISGNASQGFCSETLSETISPFAYVIDDTGYSITGLPPGVTAGLVGDTLTIAGTLTGVGYWYYTITTDNNCVAQGAIRMDQSVDPGLSCSADGDSITLTWQQEWASTEGTLFGNWDYGGDQNGNFLLFLPEPSVTLGGFPPATEVHFTLFLSYGTPYCTNGLQELTCSTLSVGIEDLEHTSFSISPNPAGQFIQLVGAGRIDQVRIYDLLGHEVGPRMVQPRSGQIDVSSLEPGAYVMQILSNGRKTFLRFIKD